MTYAPARPALAPHADTTASRNVTKWVLALALFFSLFGFFTALQAFQMTSETTSERTLRRAVAVVSEIDVLLDRHYEDLQQRAESADIDDTLVLQDFPVTVPLTTEEVQTLSRDELRELLLDRAASTMYDDGTGAMRDDASTGEVGTFSVGGSIDQSLDLLRDDVHLAMGVLMIVLGAISLVLALALAAVTRGLGRIVAVGAVALASSIVLLVLAVLGRLSLNVDDSSEYVRLEFLEIAQELAWVPIRNGAILVALTAFVTAIAAIAARISDMRTDRAHHA